MSDRPDSPGSEEDHALIARAVQGDEAAFTALVGRKRERVYWIAYRIVGNQDDAREIAQATFVRLWQVLSRYRPGQSFDTWLYRITVNLSIDHYRSRGPMRSQVPLEGPEALRSGTAVLPAQGASPLESLASAELGAVFERIAARLGEKQRAVFVLSQIEGMPTEEIARIMGITHSTVRNHLAQARKTLQDALRRLYPEYWRAGRSGRRGDPL